MKSTFWMTAHETEVELKRLAGQMDRIRRLLPLYAARQRLEALRRLGLKPERLPK